MDIDKNHNQKKSIFKVVGLIVLGLGLYLVISGFISFFQLSNSFDSEPKIGLVFAGMPLLFIGLILTSLGFMGDVARYQAGEMAPVGKDVVNYMVDGTKESMTTVAKAIHDGMNSTHDASIKCPHCFTENETEAKFCKNCGKSLASDKVCRICHEKNESDAKYCDHCGNPL